MNRRNFLKTGVASTISSMATGVSVFSYTDANAQSDDYKALIYVYMVGGNDGFNCFVPMDEAIYKIYNKSRGGADGVALRRNAGDPGISGDNGLLIPLDGPEHLGMHPSMKPLQSFWNDKSMAIITNVGPLVRPITKTEYAGLVRDGDSSQIPNQLFDHGGQQNCWHNAMGDPKVQSGWGGRALQNAGKGKSYSFAGDKRWGQAPRVAQLRLSGTALSYDDNAIKQSGVTTTSRLDLIKMLVGSATGSTSEFVKAWGEQEKSTIDVNETISPLFSGTPAAEIATGFAAARDVAFVRHLRRAATIISARSKLGGVRDIICVGTGDFDTHSNQLQRHPILLRDMSEALTGFTNTMRLMGLSDKVTVMTASDFGRSLKPNSSNGTDHAWGNCQLVLGGAVRGQKSYGIWPDYALDGADDKGSGPNAKGQFIPTTSVNQYAATVLDWFLPNSQMSSVLPDLANFTVKNLGFMKPGV
ncbi:DUF1501 domain-containing protein [Undibacterium sp. TC9W]|uniref:DUF1501 domain-containing protein n=1 Tax=Undibacterium sp. TC9W TaxID=3413053 RepID=UPI003BF1F20A